MIPKHPRFEDCSRIGVLGVRNIQYRYFLPARYFQERLWRKTRQQHPGSGGCVGVDPNRNWGFHWMGTLKTNRRKIEELNFGRYHLNDLLSLSCGPEGGASDNPCSDLFAGPEPFSEPCTKIVSDYILQLNADGNLVAFFTIHNYSQMWLTPYGYDEIYPDNYDELVRKILNHIFCALFRWSTWVIAAPFVPYT